jgi:hypothetical protein
MEDSRIFQLSDRPVVSAKMRLLRLFAVTMVDCNELAKATMAAWNPTRQISLGG